ncbi:MAG: Uncharacterised protein [Rhodospirillaceae bacterium]|nr:MAG: Uncharacterised protein [Rhodospirillaceae bacterium]
MGRDLHVVEKHQLSTRMGVEVAHAVFRAGHGGGELDRHADRVDNAQGQALKGALDPSRVIPPGRQPVEGTPQIIVAEHAVADGPNLPGAVPVNLVKTQ